MGDSQLKKLVIIGASGHGKVIADIALNNQYDEIVFLDDDKRVTECAGFAVKGTAGWMCLKGWILTLREESFVCFWGRLVPVSLRF